MKFSGYIFMKRRTGFTLIEILVVISIISLLMAILIPSLRLAKTITKRTLCIGNLKQIALAWDMYLDDYNGDFYQNTNANLNYGGWQGMVGWSNRPLNSYFNLPSDIEDEDEAKIFCCPADRGGVPPEYSIHEKAYRYLGTSYQTNIMLIGPNQLLVLNDKFRNLHEEVNKRIRNMNRDRADNPYQLLLIGDYGWYNQSKPAELPFEEWKSLAEWHGDEDSYNMAFLDGHIEFLNIKKGSYVTDQYTVLPFKDLYEMASASQDN